MERDASSGPKKTADVRGLRSIEALMRAATSWLALTLAIAVAPGLAVWPLAHHTQLGRLMDNELDGELRIDLLSAMGLSAVCVLAFYVAVHLWLRKQRPRRSFPETCRALNRYTFLTLAFPVVTALMHRGIENEHPFITLLLIGVVTALAGVFVYRVLELRPSLGDREPNWRHWLAVVMIGAFYASYVSFLAVLDHRNLGTHIYDLGIYDNIFWNTTFDDFLGCSYCKLGKHVSAHFDPIILLFSPIYRLAPNAETILILQTVWLSTGVYPLFLMAQRHLKNPRLAALFCGVYILYPALHGVNMFDFHSLTLVVPTVMWLIYFIDTGARGRLWLMLALMLMTREDMPLLACFLGAYTMLRRRPTTGLLMIFVSLTYLVVVKRFFMPDPGLLMSSKGTESYAHFFAEMIPNEEEGVKGFVVSLLTNPIYALQVLFKEDRIFFFMVLLQPLLFLPLLGGRKRFIMIYGLLFLGLASRKYVYDLHFQYSSVLFPVLLAATPDGIVAATRSRVVDVFNLDRRRVPAALMWMMLVCTGLTSVKYGVMTPNDHFKAGWNRLSRSLNEDRYEYFRSLVDQVPPEAPVCTTSSLGPHVSNRDLAHKWPACKDSEWAILLSGRFKKKDERRLKRHVRRGKYERIDGDHDIELYRINVDEEDRREAARDRREDKRKLKEGRRGKPVEKKDEGDGTRPEENASKPDDVSATEGGEDPSEGNPHAPDDLQEE